MNKLITSLTIVAMSLFLIINGMSNNTFTAKQYAIDTYLYILLGVTITALSIAIIDAIPMLRQLKSSYVSLAVGCFVMLALIFIMVRTANDKKLIVKTSWVLFMFMMGFMFRTYFKMKKKETINGAYVSLFLIALSFAWWVLTQPIDSFKLCDSYLFAFFGYLFVFSLLAFFGMKSYQTSTLSKKYKSLSLFGLFLFSLFIIHDTQNMINRGSAIERDLNSGMLDSSDLVHIVDYPTQTVTLYLGGINLFHGVSGRKY